MKSRREALSDILRGKDFSKFEKSTYRVVCRIPPGEVRSYKWVARRMGCPGGARAVGNALNKNQYPGPIPCHRVVKSDGSIGGFSRGVRLKKRLLASEGIDYGTGRCYNRRRTAGR